MVEAPGYIFIKSIDISVTVRSRSNLKTVLNRFEHDESFKKKPHGYICSINYC
jgi:hypothetical protein